MAAFQIFFANTAAGSVDPSILVSDTVPSVVENVRRYAEYWKTQILDKSIPKIHVRIKGRNVRRTFPQKCLYHPHVSQALHSPTPQLIRLCHTFSWITSLVNSFLFGSLGRGTRQAAKPSNVQESTDFCSLVSELNALIAVVRAGDSMWSSGGT